MNDDEELKQIDDTLSTKEADAVAKSLTANAKKKKRRKPTKPRRPRKCSAGHCQRKPTHTVVRVIAVVDEETNTINFKENHLIRASCYKHAKTMLQRFKRIEVPNVRLEHLWS